MRSAGDIAWLCAPGWDDAAVLSGLIGGDGTYSVTAAERNVWGGYYEPGTLIWRNRWTTSETIVLVRYPRLRLVAFGAGAEGNVFAWADGNLVLPLKDVLVADTTGGGDAFVAALTLALIRGEQPESAAAAAVAAAHTVGHAGGRPSLGPGVINSPV